jgi:hypothetical protein
MEINTKIYQTPNGLVEGVQTKWPGFNGVAAAIVESTPDNPIGTLERFGNRKITKANAKAQALGIKEGMDVTEAFALIA